MRKQNKIISLVLVVALLLGMLVIVPAAEDASASGSSTFTPTATWVEDAQTTSNTTAVSGASGIIAGAFTGASFCYQTNGTGNVNYSVTETESGNVYGTIVANSATSIGSQYVAFNGASLTLNHDGYVVVELDIASESDFLTGLNIGTVIRPSGGDYTTDLGASSYFGSHVIGKYNDGAWHRLTVIMDVASATTGVAPKLYTFIDGEFLCEGSANNKANYDTTKTYAFSSIRINVSSTTLNVGDSISYDNVTASVVTGDAYATAVANKSLAGTGLATAPVAEKLPAIATVDGVEYYTVAALNTVLGGVKPVEVEILRQFAGTVTVNCDATVDTNGRIGTIVAGSSIENTTTNGNVTTYEAAFKTSISVGDMLTNTTDGKQTIVDAVRDDEMEGNLLPDTFTNSNNVININNIGDGSNVYPTMHVLSNVATAEQMLYRKSNASYVAADHDSYFEFRSNYSFLPTDGGYIVFEFDFFRNGNSGSALGIAPLVKLNNSSGTSVYGSAGMERAITQNLIPDGEFSRVTFVFDVSTGAGKVFYNGVMDSWDFKLYGDLSGVTYDNLYLLGFRMFQDNNEDIVIDNVSVRHIQNEQLATAISTGNLAAWEGAVTAPKASYPPIALVDGEYVETVNDLNDILSTSRKPVNVEILRDDSIAILVDCDATVNTNGCAVTVNKSDEVTITSSEGNVTVYDAPYKKSLAMGDQLMNSTQVLNQVKYPASDNVVKIGVFNAFTGGTGTGNDGNPANFPSAYTASNTVDGNTFLYYETEGATSNANAFIDYSYSAIIAYDAENPQYLVYDFDFSFVDAVGVAGLSFIVRSRNTAGTSNMGTVTGSSVNLHQYVKDYDNFHHITVVYDLHNNMSYYFADGFIHSQTGTVMTAEGHGIFTGANNTNNYTIYFDGMRIAQNPLTDMAIDNMYLRYLKGDEAGNITEAITAGDISKWNKTVYTGAEDDVQFPPIAEVDGNVVADAAELNALLSDPRKTANVEFLRDTNATVTVSCDATVNTNGCAVNVAAGTGVTIVSTEGNVTVYDAPFKKSSSSVEVTNENTADVLAAIKGNLPGNLVTTTVQNNIDGLHNTSEQHNQVGQIITNVYADEQYLQVNYADNGGTNGYLEPGFNNNNNPYTNNDNAQYFVVDYDIALLAATEVGMQLVTRNSSGSNISASSYYASQILGYSDVGTLKHVTLVFDLDNNASYVFIDGVYNSTYSRTSDAFVSTANHTSLWTGTGIKITGFRIGQGMKGGYILDNFNGRYIEVADTTAEGNLSAAMANTDLTAWTDAVYTVETTLAPLASVNGVDVTDLDAVANAPAGAKIEILCDLTDDVVLGNTATVNTNGCTCNLVAEVGYRVDEAGENTYSVVVEDRTAYVTVTVNGKTAYALNLLYGTNVLDYLTEKYGIQGEVFADAQGTVYTGADLSALDVAVSGVATLDVTGTAYTGMYVYIVNGVVTSAEQTVTGLYNVLKNGVEATVILNSDVEFVDQYGINLNKKFINLNGHTLGAKYDVLYAAGGAQYPHDFCVTAGTTTIVNGTIDSVKVNRTDMSIFNPAASGDTDIVLVLEDLTVIANRSFAQGRAGQMIINNCDISISGTTGYFINYDGAYTHAIGVTMTDTHVRYAPTSGNSFICVNNANYTSVDFVVDNCVLELNTNGRLGYLYQAHTTVTFTNTDIYASAGVYTYKYSNNNGALVIGEGCRVLRPLSSTSYNPYGALVADGCTEVYSGSAQLPYAYTSEYATVTWPDGTTEKWAAGVVPYNASYPKANVCVVEAGQSYTFEETTAVIKVKANLTLDSNITLNLYVLPDVGVTAMYFDGVAVEGTTVNLDGADYVKYSYAIAPNKAIEDIVVSISTEDVTIAKVVSLYSYFTAVQSSSTDAGKALVAHVMNYVYASYCYEERVTAATVANYSGATANYTTQEVTGTAADTSNATAYIESAQLNIGTTLKYRFNLVTAADISTLKFTVNGTEVEYVLGNGYVEIELNVSDMLADIVITVDGNIIGNYNLYTYYEATKADSKVEAVVKAVYNYAYYAAEFAAGN